MIKKERLVRLTQAVLRYDSCNPPGNELELSKFIVKDMQEAGLDVETHSFQKDRPNVIATLRGSLPRQQAEKEAILITPHFDTVPIGQGWKMEPFGGQIKGGRIYGRGASDDKGNLACCMEVMRSMVEDGFKPRKDIIMAATVDEETGSHSGIIPLLEKKIVKPKYALITDSEDYDTVVAQKGLIHTRIQIFGRKAHGAYNWLGDSAIERAAEVIRALKKHKFAYKKHKLLHPPTVNIGMIRGGDKVNMVADFCEFAADFRFPPGRTGKDVLAEAASVVASVTKNFKIEIDDMQAPYLIDPKHPFVKSYLDTAKTMKIDANLKGSEGATVITFFQRFGIPAFSTGYGKRGTMHANDEYAEIKTLYNGSRLLEAYLKVYDESNF